MRKILATGLAALAIVALATPHASAWLNVQVGVGVNFGWQCGGNDWCWGLWHCGDLPYDHDHHHPHFYAAPPVYPYAWVGHPHHAQMPAPTFQPFAPMQQYSTYSGAGYYYYYPMSNSYYGYGR